MSRLLISLACVLAVGLLDVVAFATPLTIGDVYRIDFTTNPDGWSVPSGCPDPLDVVPCPPDTFSLTFFGDSEFTSVAHLRLSVFAGSDIVGSADFEGDFDAHPYISLATESSPPVNPLQPFVARMPDAGWNDAVFSGCMGCYAEFEIIAGMLMLDAPNLEIALSRKDRHGDGNYYVTGPVAWFEVTEQGVVPEPAVLWLLLTAGAAVKRRRIAGCARMAVAAMIRLKVAR